MAHTYPHIHTLRYTHSHSHIVEEDDSTNHVLVASSSYCNSYVGYNNKTVQHLNLAPACIR